MEIVLTVVVGVSVATLSTLIVWLIKGRIERTERDVQKLDQEKVDQTAFASHQESLKVSLDSIMQGQGIIVGELKTMHGCIGDLKGDVGELKGKFARRD